LSALLPMGCGHSIRAVQPGPAPLHNGWTYEFQIGNTVRGTAGAYFISDV
jgi:hypothetical protein